MSTQNIVTIGIPTYGRPEGVGNTLRRVIQQTYPHLEIIVSENNSPDAAAYDKVFEEFKGDKRVRVVSQKENLGSLGNFEFLANEATGEFFLWVPTTMTLNWTTSRHCLQSRKKIPKLP